MLVSNQVRTTQANSLPFLSGQIPDEKPSIGGAQPYQYLQGDLSAATRCGDTTPSPIT